jgi:cell division septal protein FtsQ
MGKKNNKRQLHFSPWLFIVIIFILFLISGVFLFNSFLRNSSLFMVREINVLNQGGLKPNLEYLKGRNIFSLNLKEITEDIKGNFFSVEDVRISRFLPGRLIIQIRERQPIAVVVLGSKINPKHFFVDKGGMLLDIKDSDMKGKIFISGLSDRLTNPRAGKVYYDQLFLYSLDLIKSMGNFSDLKPYNIKRININDSLNLSFFIEPVILTNGADLVRSNVIEAIMPMKDLSAKIKILTKLLNALSDNISNIEYVDLRFDKPVVKQRI